MAETARQVIDKALRMIWRTGDEEPINAVDMDRGIEALNNLMDELEEEGVDLDYTTVTDQTDEVTVVDGALRSVKRVLSYDMWELYYKNSPQPITDRLYNKSMDTLLNIGFEVDEAEYPDTCPVGTGNSNIREYPFFPSNEEDD